MSIKLKGSSDGSVSFDAPADTSPSGSDITLTLPTSAGSADQFLKNSGIAGELEYSSMVETSTGIGIGTSSPSTKLHIASNAAGGDVFISNASGQNCLLEIAGNGNTLASTSALYGQDASNNVYGGWARGAHPVRFGTGNAEAMRLDSDGRLLVGTTSSSEDCSTVFEGSSSSAAGIVHLSRSSGVSNGSTLGALSFSDNAQNDYAQIKSAAGATPSGSSFPGKLLFLTTGSGSTSLSERAQIDHRGQTTWKSDGTASIDHVFTTVAGSSSSNKLMSYRRNAASGVSLGSSGDEVCVIRRNGDLDNTNNSYGALSDIKLKENVVDANSQWEDVKNLRVRNYNFKAETGNDTHTQLGLIAQEVETVSPGLVSETHDLDAGGNDLGTTTKSVSYSVLYMKAVKALQEAQTRIETLESQHADLLARVTALEAA